MYDHKMYQYQFTNKAAGSNDECITIKAQAGAEPLYMREPNPTEPASKLSLYYRPPSITYRKVIFLSIGKKKSTKHDGNSRLLESEREQL